MGKHKHKTKSSKKKKHRSSSPEDGTEIDIEKKSHRHHKKHHKEKKKHKKKDQALSDDEFGPPEAKLARVSSSSSSSLSPSPNMVSSNTEQDYYGRYSDLEDDHYSASNRLEDDLASENYSKHKEAKITEVVDIESIRKKLGSKRKHQETSAVPSKGNDSRSHHVVKKDFSLSPPPMSPPSGSNATAASSSESLSIEETNKLRLKLGLKPLDVSSSSQPPPKPKSGHEQEKVYKAQDTGEEFYHKPAKNMSELKQTEKIAQKLKERKERRELEKRMLNVKKLADDDSDDDASNWVLKSRKIQTAKELAEKKAKELDAMDEVFGIGDLIDQEIKTEKSKVYTAQHIKGLKVEHDIKDFSEGKNVILTLKDQDILAEDAADTLINVNMVDDEKHKKNVITRKQKGGKFGYSALDEDEFDENGDPIERNLLSKYDEEIEGTKKKSFALGDNNYEEMKKNEVRQKLFGNRRCESLSTTSLKLASDFLTEDEVNVKFKKPKKKVRKIRKTKLRADDLLNSAPDQFEDIKPNVKSDPDVDHLSTRHRRHHVDIPVKEEPDDSMELDVDDTEVPEEDLSEIKMLEMDDGELQIALNKARKLKQRETLVENKLEEVAKSIIEDREIKNEPGGAIILNSTAEFCRTLGDIPTYGQAGNRGEEEQELLDFEREMKQEREREEQHKKFGGWNDVAMESTSTINLPPEAPILEAEPDLGRGIAGALNLAVSKGYLEKEIVKRPSASRFAHLQAQNYSIDDKAHQEDDKFGRRERYAGPTTEFKEKEGYKPNINLDYIDDDGHLLSSKEAFRYLSHKFHGKGPSKNKIEKRMKKVEQEALMKQMASTDTPLGTLNMLQSKQKETQSAYVVLSGSKQLQSTALSKVKR